MECHEGFEHCSTSTFYIDGKGETPTFDVNELGFPHPSNWTIPLAIFKQKRGMFHFGYQESKHPKNPFLIQDP